MKKSVCAVVFLGLVSAQVALGAMTRPGSDFRNYEYCVTEDGAFGLYLPKGWKATTQTFPNGRMVYVVDPKDTAFASMTLLEPVDPNLNAAGLAAATIKNIRLQQKDLKPVEARSDAGRTHTLVTYQRRGLQSLPIQGRYYFNVQQGRAVVTGLEAPSSTFKETSATLLTIIANIQAFDPKTYQSLTSQKGNQGPVKLPMQEVSAQDNTCRLKIPQGWNLTAGKGAALVTTENGDAGYLFSTIAFVGQSRIPYFDSRNIPGDLRFEYMPPIEALITASRHYGSRNHQVLERHANPTVAAQAVTFLKRGAEAEVALVSFISKNNVPGIGYYDVVGFQPDNAGQWFIMVIGFWAPGEKFAWYLPTLLEVAESFRINEAWASDYVKRGMQKVREMMQTTSSMMSRYTQEMRESSLAAHQNRMRSSDFISYKFSTYMRGEQEWVTSLEGGKIYSTDHHGLSSGGQTIIEGQDFNYYNYQGDTRYGHIPVDVSREVFETIK